MAEIKAYAAKDNPTAADALIEGFYTAAEQLGNIKFRLTKYSATSPGP
jgi:hypothetical protein